MAGLSDRLEFESVYDAGDVFSAVLARARQRTRAEIESAPKREAQDRIHQGTGAMPTNVSGALNPATGTWQEWSVPGVPGSMNTITFYPRPD